MIEARHIRAAREHLAGRIHRTPLLPAERLTDSAGPNLYVKAESLQQTGSFKVRGVLNRIRTLSPEERQRGLIAISAGNHAAAVAWAAGTEGIESTVVMPAHASPAKVEASRAYGANVVLHGDVFEAFERMHLLRERHGYTLIHPFDDQDVIAGHGTIGLEVADDLPDVDLVLVPVGGGGLLAGIATAIKAVRPSARVIGVEPVGAPNLRAGLDAGRVVRLEQIDTIADGLAPPMTGERVLAQVRAFVDDVVSVTDDDIIAAMKLLMTRIGLFVEPSGAAGLAALIAGAVSRPPSSAVAIIASGGNIDLNRLKEWL